MQSGPDNLTEETIGVNYRALKDLFVLSEQRKDVISYEISVQMLEIYNEQVRDLLATDGSNKRYPILIYIKLLTTKYFLNSILLCYAQLLILILLFLDLILNACIH